MRLSQSSDRAHCNPRGLQGEEHRKQKPEDKGSRVENEDVHCTLKRGEEPPAKENERNKGVQLESRQLFSSGPLYQLALKSTVTLIGAFGI